MKIESLVANVTAVGCPARAEHGFFGVFLGVFGQFRSLFWSGSHFAVWASPLEPLYLYLGSFNENAMIGYHILAAIGPLTQQNVQF